MAKELTDPSKSTAVKLKVAVSGGDVDSPNFQSLLYDLAPASYQLGIIAARVSHGGKIGFIGGMPLPTVTAMARGYEAGAKSVDPNTSVNVVYTDNWDNPAIAKAKAEALLNQGVYVIMQNVDAASSGVFEAIKAQNEKTGQHPWAYTFGANKDQNNNKICPDYTLASAVIKLDVAFGKVIEQVKTGSFHGGLVKEDLNNGICVTVINPNPKVIGTVVDDQTQKLVEDAGRKLAAGQIRIPNP